MRRTEGKVSIAQIVVLAGLVAGGYFGVQYLPVLTSKGAAKDIARVAAVKMNVEPNDSVIREYIDTEARKRKLPIGPSQVVLRRDFPQPGMYTVELGWTHQTKHVWGKNVVRQLKVSETSDGTTGKILKNAE